MSDNKPRMFELTRTWFDFAFTKEDVRPIHHAIYFYALQLNNLLGWKESFGLPTAQAMEATGIRSYNTFSKAFNELISWEVIDLRKKSENQFQANIIALSKIDKSSNKSLDKSLDKSVLNHNSNHKRINGQISDSIVKPINHKPRNQETIEREFRKKAHSLPTNLPKVEVDKFLDYWTEKNPKGVKMKFQKEKTFDPEKRLRTWEKNYHEWQKKSLSEKPSFFEKAKNV